MSVELRPLNDEEFADWLPRMCERYGDDMITNAGMSLEKAREKATADISRVFPDGKPTPDQLVYGIVADGERVGELWLCERDGEMFRNLFIYEIRIDSRHRGKGYGKAGMLLAEKEARSRGLDRVMLNVFGGNDVARNLYRSLGYEENAVAMSKKL